jgi:hypothetical protein
MPKRDCADDGDNRQKKDPNANHRGKFSKNFPAHISPAKF